MPQKNYLGTSLRLETWFLAVRKDCFTPDDGILELKNQVSTSNHKKIPGNISRQLCRSVF
jgi:hypothetical protein